MKRTVGWTLAWLVAATLAIVVGLVAVSSVGAGLRGRGPLGDNEAIRQARLAEIRDDTIDPGEAAQLAPGERRVLSDEFGDFVVECQGPYAVGVDARPDSAAGWSTVSIDRGPDDDVDAVFQNGLRSIEIEVFCNQGIPTVAEIERDELTADD